MHWISVLYVLDFYVLARFIWVPMRKLISVNMHANVLNAMP